MKLIERFLRRHKIAAQGDNEPYASYGTKDWRWMEGLAGILCCCRIPVLVCMAVLSAYLLETRGGHILLPRTKSGTRSTTSTTAQTEG